MTFAIEFDEVSMRQTARAVKRFNEYYPTGRDVDSIVDSMRWHAYDVFRELRGSYCATGGWMLTAYVIPADVNGDRAARLGIKASVCASLFSEPGDYGMPRRDTFQSA